MKVGFVSPPVEFSEHFLDVARKDFPHVQVELLAYRDFSEVPALLEDKQESFDAVIFAGVVAMDYANNYLPRKTLWLCLNLFGISLFRALLLATRAGHHIQNLSFDTYDSSTLHDIFIDLGHNIPEAAFKVFKGDTLSSEYNNLVYEHHVRNYRINGVSACITTLQKVHERLNEDNIPNFIVYPIRNVMREQLAFACQMSQARREAKGNIVVMMVSMGYPSDYSIMLGGNDEFISQKIKIYKQIYRYAGHLRAAVIEESPRDFMLLSTRDIVSLETRQFSHLSLLDWMECEVHYPVAVGIGCGDDVEMAKENAVRAMLQAKKGDSTSAYVYTGEGGMLGPIVAVRHVDREEAEPRVDAKLLQIAEKVDLSVNTIYNLHRFLARTNKGGYTSQELANGLGYSKRYTDRLLQRLEELKYVSVSGKRILGKTGRPVRILTFHKDLC